MSRVKTSGTDATAYMDPFLDHLWLEFGLSDNTLAAYRSDLSLTAKWLRQERTKSLQAASKQDLLEYFRVRYSQGWHSSSSARLLSSLKRYFHYLSQQAHIK